MVLLMKNLMTNDFRKLTPDVTFVTEKFGELSPNEAIQLLLRRVNESEERIAELSDLVNILIGRISHLQDK